MAAAVAAGALAAALAVAGVPASAQEDPARAALARTDAYVHPGVERALPGARARLNAAALRLSRPDRPVKLAIVSGPAGAPSMRLYTRRLARHLEYEGTLAVTAPGRPVVAVGPRPPREITLRLREERVGRIGSPVERVIRAAELAAPPAEGGGGSGVREITGLLAIALVGGAWAVAWGLRREGRRSREEAAEARAWMRVLLDALRARATLLGRREDLPPAARALTERSLGVYAEAASALSEARRAADVRALLPRVRAGLDAAAEAAALIGDPRPAKDPFAGLCGLDPAHGAAVAEAVLPGGEGPVPLCGRCRQAVEDGDPPAPRLLPVEGRPVPFSDPEAGVAAAWEAGAAATAEDGATASRS